MTKVITYGTYDLLHYGHVKLLERAKALGDYLIVGVTSDDFDRSRGKINVQQSLAERVEAVRQTGLADQIIIEEYEGQKIDDIRRYDVDIFTVGSDWEGKFDYLKEYCQVVYLPRTEGVSSSKIRTDERHVRLGLVGGNRTILKKYYKESLTVNGIDIAGIYQSQEMEGVQDVKGNIDVFDSYEDLLKQCDAVYIVSAPKDHYRQIKEALYSGKHVLCESPVAISLDECRELEKLAADKKLILMDAIKTAYSMAYNRLLLLVKSGVIGRPVSIDATCTSLKDLDDPQYLEEAWNNFAMWGPTGMLPVLQILGTDYSDLSIVTLPSSHVGFDAYTRLSFTYKDSVAMVQTGAGVKSEGDLVIAGTKGYIYVPAPWWKTDYFEARFENPVNNRKYFYQLDGEGIRYELVAFVKAIERGRNFSYIDRDVTEKICEAMGAFGKGESTMLLGKE
jgi:choline-phosphate cytidylyltransferase